MKRFGSKEEIKSLLDLCHAGWGFEVQNQGACRKILCSELGQQLIPKNKF